MKNGEFSVPFLAEGASLQRNANSTFLTTGKVMAK